VGAGETHISYQTPADLPKLILKTSELLHRPILSGKYFVDQINHEYVSDNVLLSKRLYKCVILLRQPEATIKSLMSLLKCQEKEALELYVNRLAALSRYGMLLRERALVVEYDDLVDHSEDTLAALTRFLALDSPLTANYETHRMTGRVAGYGDPSSNIKIGQIMRTPTHQITISEDILVAAVGTFQKCRAQLHEETAQTANNLSSGGNVGSMTLPDERHITSHAD
jgi:hypothetical protein